METSADHLTIDVYAHPIRRTPRTRRTARSALSASIDGLRAATVNFVNTGTHTLVPRPTGTCLVIAWDSPEAARDGWRGPLGTALGRRGDYRLDGEVVRSRTEHGDDHWHGWRPSAHGATPLERDEPMVAVVHGVVQPRYLRTFYADNLHAASRAAHHPGHRGSIDIFRGSPFENTSISLWSTLSQAQDYAYKPGGHAHAMKHSRELSSHHTGVYLQVRPLASTGGLGRPAPSFPDLPPTTP
jgi:hypothetical protein